MVTTGWFSDTSANAGKRFPWQPCLQIDEFYCVSIDIWFATNRECDHFIQEKIIGQTMYGEEQQ